MKKLLGCCLCVMLLVFGVSIAGAVDIPPYYVDLTDFGKGDTGTITNSYGDAIFTVADVQLSYPSSGTGIFQPYISIGADSQTYIGSGMGTDAVGQFDNKRMGNPLKRDGWTHSLFIGDLNLLGNGKYEFLIDINEPNNADSLITLTNLQIYVAHSGSGASSAAMSGFGTEQNWDDGELGTLVYSLDYTGFDGSVLMDYTWWKGQGQNVDTIVEVPFVLPAGTSPDDYVYTYWAFSGAHADFEEIIVRGLSVPEPATLLLLGSGLIVLAGFSRKKFKV